MSPAELHPLAMSRAQVDSRVSDLNRCIGQGNWRIAKLLLEELEEGGAQSFLSCARECDLLLLESIETGIPLSHLRDYGFVDHRVNLRWNVVLCLQANRFECAKAFWAELHQEEPGVYGLDFCVLGDDQQTRVFAQAVDRFCETAALETATESHRQIRYAE